MPSKNVKFGKYRSRRSKAKGGGLMGDVGSALDTVGSFVKTSGRDVANVASKAAPLLGKAVSYVGSTIDDDAGIGKAMQDVGNFTANTGSTIMNELGKASPAIGDATSWVGKQMKRADQGGGLFHSLKFQHGKHAARVVSKLDDHEYGAMQSAARYISGHGHLPGSHPILHHRHSRTVPVKHFHKILSSTRSQLAESLHKAKHHMLHSAVTSSLHSAHIGGGIELETRRHVGGGLWDKVGNAIGQFNKIDFNDPVSGWENTIKGMGELSQGAFDVAAEYVPSSMKDLTKGAGTVLKTVDYALGDAGRMVEKVL